MDKTEEKKMAKVVLRLLIIGTALLILLGFYAYYLNSLLLAQLDIVGIGCLILLWFTRPK